MLLNVRRPSFRNITTRCLKSIVVTLASRINDWWRGRVNRHRLGMRTSGQTQWQKQSSECNPFLHVISSQGGIRRPTRLQQDA
jgi:hypothetical protein